MTKPIKIKTTKLFKEAQLLPADKAGREWSVVIIGAASPDEIVEINGEQFVTSKNQRLYSVAGLEGSVAQWEGVKVFDNHLTNEQYIEKGGMRSPNNEWLGSIVEVMFDAGNAQLQGVFKVVDDDLAKKLKNAFEMGILDTIGLSIDAFPIVNREAEYLGIMVPVVDGFDKILSVDLVGDPAAGGGFNRILAAENKSNLEEAATMDEDKVKQMIDEAMTSNLSVLAELIDEKLIPAPVEVTEPEAVDDVEIEVTVTEPEVEAVPEPVQENEQIQRLESRVILAEKLAQSGLTGKLKEAVQSQFSGKIFAEADLDRMVEQMQKIQADSDPTGRVSEGGKERGRIEVGMTGDEKASVEVMRLIMGRNRFNELEHNQTDFVQDRVGEADFYKSWLNNGKPNTGNYTRLSTLASQMLGGNPLLDGRAMEASTLATAIKNTVNIFVAADYSKRHRWFESIVTTEEVDTIDDATLARFYGTSTLSRVEEGAAYTELFLQDEEETAVFHKRGNYIAVTLEHIMKDKTNQIRSIPTRLANAWFNTLSSQTAAVFTINAGIGPTLSDTGALFNATAATTGGGHANLLTTALDFTPWDAANIAMMGQTDQPLGVGEKVLIESKYLLVPINLRTQGLTVRNTQYLPGSPNNDINPYYQQFDVITVPSWTDTNNWAAVADPTRYPAIYHIFPRGNRTPQIFTADNQEAGALFTNDEFRFKVRMMTYEQSATDNCSPVADFRPLHKSNVA